MNADLPPPLDPAPPTAPGPHPAGQGLVEWVRGSRPAASYLFLGLSVLLLGATIALAVRGVRTTKAAEPPAAKLDDPDAPEVKPVEVADPKRGSYLTGAIAALWGFLVTAGAGAYLLVGLPKPTAAEQRTEARVVLLAAGGLLGFGLLVLGGVFFYQWSASLTAWLDKGERKEMLYVVVPLLLVVAGAGLVFLAVQPARAEERHNQLLRRLVYGTNLGLTALLLVLVLAAANVVVALKFPAKLDATEAGFYTLTDTTKAFLQTLPEPAALYVILPDSRDRLFNDIRQFGYEAQDAAGGRLKVRFVSPATDKRELADLQAKYPRIGKDDDGILVTAGEDEKRNAFVTLRDLFEIEPGMPGRGGGRVSKFVGEARVMRELRYLADNEQKPVIYFTQGNGEPALSAGGELADGPAATRLKGFLEKAYLDVRPLNLGARGAAAPEVPADAAAVVVIDPQTPLGEGAAGAVRKYMTEKKGRLVVLAGGVAGPDGKPVKTGLEGLLGEMGVRLGDKFIYSEPVQGAVDYRAAVVGFARQAEQNPIVQTVGKQVRALSFLLPREVAAGPGGGGPYQATPLMITFPGRDTWLEDELIRDPEQVITEVLTSAPARQRKGFTDTPRTVAAIVTEGTTPRAVVVGSGAAFTDRAAERSRSGSTPVAFDLLAAGLDWLREKPPLPATLEGKAYQEYQFPEPAAVDFTRLVWFPLGLGLLVVAGLGAGVWVMRRK